MYKWNYKKCFCNLLTAAAVVALAWFTLSYLEIISKNIFGGATYSDFNIIVNLTNYFIPGGF